MMEKQEKIGLAVYLYYNRDVRKVAKLGEMVYHSKRFRYLILYVGASEVGRIQQELEGQRFVKAVKPSALATIDQDFVGSLYR